MALALNKTALKRQRDHLEMYRRFLPSLDLKRQQLIADYQRAKAALAATENEIESTARSQAGLLSLLGASQQELGDLVRVDTVAIGEENQLGVRLPVLGEVTYRVADYSMLAKPFWVDFLVEHLQIVATLHLRCRIERRRAIRLHEAVRRITQRVNLFEKILIPRAELAIRRIRVYLADADRAAVVRSKIAKAKHHRGETTREVL